MLIKYNGTDTEITLPDTVKCVAGFDVYYPINSISMPNVEIIGNWAFRTVEMKSIDMPNIERIGNKAFEGCKTLESVSMPQVASIGATAFANCESLTSVVMEQLKSIDEYAFNSCYNLTTVEMPQVELIKSCAFINCSKLTSFVISADNEHYSSENGILYNKDKTELIAYPSAKGDIVIADSVKRIDKSAFLNCYELESVSMPQVTSIGDYAFMHCYKVTSMSMPQLVSTGEDSFSFCTELESASMPQVISIGYGAFRDDLKLASVEMPQVASIGEYAFAGCTSLANFVISADNEYFSSEDGIIYNKDKSELIAYPSANGDIVIADSVKRIAESAFFNCYKIKSVVLPQVTGIGNWAFGSCSNLTAAYFYSDAPTEFGNGVFDECAEEFCIYYLEGTNGWTTPTWNGYPCKPITSEPTDEPTPERPIGDVSGDGVVNTADAVAILKNAAGLSTLTSEQQAVADVNHDGNINTADAVYILKFAAGLIEEL